MERISNIDMYVIFGYFVVVVIIGILSSKHVKSSKDFIVGGRSFGTFAIMSTQGATMKGSGALLGYCGGSWQSGVGVLFSSQCYNIGGWVAIMIGLARKLRKICEKVDIQSLGDIFAYRFSNRTRIPVAFMSMWLTLANAALQVSAIGLIINLISGGRITFTQGVITAGIIVVIYTMIGGLFSVVYTDVFQWCVMTPVIFVIIPIVLVEKLGVTPSYLRETLPTAFFSLKPSIWWIGFLISGMLTSVADLTYLTRFISAKDETAAVRGSALGFLYTVLWAGFIVFFGLAAATVITPEMVPNRDAVFPLFVLKYFPVGLVGMFVAAILATTMSTIDSYLHAGVQTFIRDIYKPFFEKGEENEEKERKILNLCRLVTVILGILSIVIVLKMKEILAIGALGYSVYAAGMFVPFIATLFWKKATEEGIIAGMVSGVITILLARYFNLVLPVIWGVLGSTLVVGVVSLIGGRRGDLIPEFSGEKGLEIKGISQDRWIFLGSLTMLTGGLFTSVGVGKWIDWVSLVIGIFLICVGAVLIKNSTPKTEISRRKIAGS